MLIIDNPLKEKRTDLPRFKKVTIKDRGIAYLWDSFNMWAWYFVVYYAFNITFLFTIIPSKTAASMTVFLWNLLRDGNKNGASWGKRKADILVINTTDFKRCTYKESLMRHGLSFISAFLITLQFIDKIPLQLIPVAIVLADVIAINNSPIGQRGGDYIAKTQVVYWDDYYAYENSIKKETEVAAEDSAKEI